MADGQMTQSTYLQIDACPGRIDNVMEQIEAIGGTITTDEGYIKDCINGKASKNILDVFNATSAAGASSVVIGQVTWTINADGTITADSNGTTLTSASTFIIFGQAAGVTASGKMYLSGCPSGGSTTTFAMSVRIGDDYYRDVGSGVEVPSGSYRQCGITIYSGTVANHTFSPMLTTLTMHAFNPAFVPYYPSLAAMWQAIRALQSGNRSANVETRGETAEQEER